MTNNRKKTPDIMANLMSGDNSTVNRKEHDDLAIKQESIKAVSISSNKTIKPAFHKIAEGLKEKATFNLSMATLEALEEAWLRLRRSAKSKSNSRYITKTMIVEAALEMALSDLEEKGESSNFYRKLGK